MIFLEQINNKLLFSFITDKWVTVALCGISKSFVGGMFIGLYKQIGEFFPTPLRASAYGIAGIVGFASTIIVPSITALVNKIKFVYLMQIY